MVDKRERTLVSEKPQNHHSNFPASWWDERRQRDYYVDASGCVQIRVGSPTDEKVRAALVAYAAELALALTPPAGSA